MLKNILVGESLNCGEAFEKKPKVIKNLTLIFFVFNVATLFSPILFCLHTHANKNWSNYTV